MYGTLCKLFAGTSEGIRLEAELACDVMWGWEGISAKRASHYESESVLRNSRAGTPTEGPYVFKRPL